MPALQLDGAPQLQALLLALLLLLLLPLPPLVALLLRWQRDRR